MIAEELTRKQEPRLMAGNDVQYVAARDEAFACNLHRIEREYRERTLSQLAHDRRHVSRSREEFRHVPGPRDMTFHELGGGLQYNDDQYLPTRFDLSLITQMTSLFFRNNSPLMKEITLLTVIQVMSGASSARPMSPSVSSTCQT